MNLTINQVDQMMSFVLIEENKSKKKGNRRFPTKGSVRQFTGAWCMCVCVGGGGGGGGVPHPIYVLRLTCFVSQ